MGLMAIDMPKGDFSMITWYVLRPPVDVTSAKRCAEKTNIPTKTIAHWDHAPNNRRSRWCRFSCPQPTPKTFASPDDFGVAIGGNDANCNALGTAQPTPLDPWIERSSWKRNPSK